MGDLVLKWLWILIPGEELHDFYVNFDPFFVLIASISSKILCCARKVDLRGYPQPLCIGPDHGRMGIGTTKNSQEWRAEPFFDKKPVEIVCVHLLSIWGTSIEMYCIYGRWKHILCKRKIQNSRCGWFIGFYYRQMQRTGQVRNDGKTGRRKCTNVSSQFQSNQNYGNVTHKYVYCV